MVALNSWEKTDLSAPRIQGDHEFRRTAKIPQTYVTATDYFLFEQNNVEVGGERVMAERQFTTPMIIENGEAV